jgi:Ca2+-binding RTX toxin-like protein
LTGLNAFDNNTGTQNGDLVISYSLPTGATTSVTQTVTVAGHFTGTNAETGVERINFNGATYAGYLLGPDDYLISRSDPANRDAGGVNLSTSTVNNFVVGEQGVNDVMTGGTANDLIFGGTGNNNLVGNLGDDLLVGSTGTDNLDSRLNAAGDDFEGAVGADTMVGGAGNDTYGVDDVLDMAVEAAGEGTDTVQTFLAALSIETMANVENLTYLGLAAAQFVGTGNTGSNTISGGDLADTLSGLAGDDTLQGGLGADTMIGGVGSDVYFVDETGDVVTETNANLATGGTDRVESDIDFTLGANVENLDLNGTAVVGRGNALANVINGNGAANQLFGGGNNDTLSGAAGNDLIDGGEGNDIISGGDNNDTIIGGTGNDTIDVGGGFNTIVYNAINFGNDVINSFDAVGGTATTQDLIDLSAFGLTAANIGTTAASRIQVENVVEAGTDDTRITVRDAGNAVIGTIYLEDVENAITATDFILAAGAPALTITGNNTSQTLNGGANAETINALGGNDTVNAGGGNDVVNGGQGLDVLNGGDGNDTLSGGAGGDNVSVADNFGTPAYSNNNGTMNWGSNWTEGGGESGSPTTGDIQIAGGRLQFNENTDGNEFIQRSVNLAGAAAAVVSFSWEGDDLDAGETVQVQAFNGTTWDNLGAALGGDTNGVINPFSMALSAAQMGSFSAIRFVANGSFEGGENFFIDNLAINFTGVDSVNGDAGDDTIVWNANAAAPTDGGDVVNGGTEGALGDTFVINGNASAETFGIYTRLAWSGLGNSLVGFNDQTEIIIARNGTTNANVIAELREIEEIRINGADPAGSGTVGGDTFQVIGDFSATSLRPNTITIQGSSANDTVDISGLTSEHSLVFNKNGGDDTVVGTLRPQDVVTDDRTLTGDASNNVLVGGGGNDTLDGDGGVDTLTGDAGDDTFLFNDGDSGNAAGTRDVITGFEGAGVAGGDVINVTEIDARFGSSDDDFTFLAADNQAFTATGQLRYREDVANNVTIVEGNTTGGTEADFQIEVAGLHKFVASDFIL